MRTIGNQNHQSFFISEVVLFLLFCNIFYTQLAFVSHVLGDFYIVCDHMTAFCFSLLLKDFDTFHELCQSLSLLFLYHLADEILDVLI